MSESSTSPLESPLSGRLKRTFTRENAAEMGRRGALARIRRLEADKAAAVKARQVTPQCARMAKQIQDIEGLMDGETDSKVLQRLAAAHEKLFSCWMVLTGTPRPGTRKTSRSAQRGPIAQNPVELAPEVPPTPQEPTPTAPAPQPIVPPVAGNGSHA